MVPGLWRGFMLGVLILISLNSYAQKSRQVWLDKKPEDCSDGSALVRLDGTYPPDTLNIWWSTGEKDLRHVNGLKAGDYHVRVRLVNKDSLVFVKDTTIWFSIEKVPCPLMVPKYFSPNDDNYNDTFTIGYIERYPEFELFIYNKSGQRVHHQKDTYQPWDGKWLGMELPDGTYYFVLFYNKKNQSEFLSGDITILR